MASDGCLDGSGSFFDRSYNRVVYVLTLATSSLLLMVLLIVFGPFRRHSRNALLTGALWASQVLPFSIISHTLGLMQAAPYGNETYAVWAVLFLLIHGISNTKVYGLQEKQQGKSPLLQDLVLLYLACWLMYLHHTEEKLSGPLLAILGVAFVKFVFRLVEKNFPYLPSCRYFGLRRRTKLIADFMNFEHGLKSSNQNSMEGYRYLVKGEENIAELIANEDYCRDNQNVIDEKVVTVERIWKCKGALLQGPDGKQLKDKCLSFALFRLLTLRCRGFSLHKEHFVKNWHLFRNGLFSKEDDHERAFGIIEDELSFLYDYYYTQYPFLFSDGKFFAARTLIYAFLECVQFLAGVWIIFALLISERFNLTDFSLRNYYFCSHNCENEIWLDLRYYACNQLPAGIHFFGTCIFLGVYVALQILQLFTIVFSNWAKVWLLCEYVDKDWLQRNGSLVNLIGWVGGWKRIPLKPWRRRIGQYSLLSSYKYRPTPYFLISAFVDIPKRGQKRQDSKKLDARLRRAVLDSLMDNSPELENGLSSLKRSKIDSQLSWACNFKSIAESILVWHVATSFCAMEEESGKGNQSPDVKEKREVAECFSGYCAYLVAFFPGLIPDPADATEVIFDKAVSDARKYLKECQGRHGVYEVLNKSVQRADEAVIVKLKDSEEKPIEEKRQVLLLMGAELGKQLLSVVSDEEKRWKVLVDFWAEMMLSLAVSNKAMAHVESLANGGEFVTHLWALLTHVGGSRKSESPLDDDKPSTATAYVQETPSGREQTNESTNSGANVHYAEQDSIDGDRQCSFHDDALGPS